MTAALKLVHSNQDETDRKLNIGTNVAPENNNDPILHNVKKAWQKRDQLPSLLQAVLETPTWKKLMPMFGILADVLIDPALSNTEKVKLQKTLREAILLMWYSYIQSQKILVEVDKNHVGKSTIEIQLMPVVGKDRTSLKMILDDEATHHKAAVGLNLLSKRLIPLCASTITNNLDEQTLIVRFLTLVRQIISEVSYQKANKK